MRYQCAANTLTEWSVQSGLEHSDPYEEIDLQVIVQDPHGCERHISAFWRVYFFMGFRLIRMVPALFKACR